MVSHNIHLLFELFWRRETESIVPRTVDMKQAMTEDAHLEGTGGKHSVFVEEGVKTFLPAKRDAQIKSPPGDTG